MSGVQKLVIDGREVLMVDYSDCNQEAMIVLATQLCELALTENKDSLVLNIFNNKSFITPKVMRHFEDVTNQTIHLIDKMAIVGLSPTKKVILKGYNLLFKRDFKAFDTQEEAIAYLMDNNKT